MSPSILQNVLNLTITGTFRSLLLLQPVWNEPMPILSTIFSLTWDWETFATLTLLSLPSPSSTLGPWNDQSLWPQVLAGENHRTLLTSSNVKSYLPNTAHSLSSSSFLAPPVAVPNHFYFNYWELWSRRNQSHLFSPLLFPEMYFPFSFWRPTAPPVFFITSLPVSSKAMYYQIFLLSLEPSISPYSQAFSSNWRHCNIFQNPRLDSSILINHLHYSLYELLN